MDIKEVTDLINDYKECLHKIQMFNSDNHFQMGSWALLKMSYWLDKYKNDQLFPSIGGKKPESTIEAASNTLFNLKMLLEEIAIKNNIKLI